MSEQVSKDLLKIMNEVADNDATIAKIDASMFVRNSEQKINEKVAYLYNMMKIEAKNCNQNQDKYYDDVNLIITHYKQKLNMVYDEFYCQYVNIQNELQDAQNNRRIAMVNYQKLINKEEKVSPTNEDVELKESIKQKNKVYKEIISLCDNEFSKSKENFEKMLNEEFVIHSKSLQIVSQQNIIQKVFGKFANIFSGSKKYQDILKEYNKTINNIDSHEIVEQMRNETIEFVADVLEKRGIDEKGLEENVRIGGKI